MLKQTIRKAGVLAFKALFASDHLDRMASEALAKTDYPLTERIVTIEPIVGSRLKFYCLGDTTLWRVQTLMEKEPETIEWINTFKPGEVFWDVGANIGLYSLYAALCGCRVVAFEPMAANYYLLCRNLDMNGLVGTKVDAYPLALSDKAGLQWLDVSVPEFGSAMHSVRKVHEGYGRQSVITETIDRLATKLPLPDHIKIDVDGFEPQVIGGAWGTLQVQVKSLQIEGRSPLAIRGFRVVKSSQAPMFYGTKYAGLMNHRYIREI